MSDYRIVLVESEEGFAAFCPALRGCNTQGSTREEALSNMRLAIEEYLAAEEDEAKLFNVSEEIISL